MARYWWTIIVGYDAKTYEGALKTAASLRKTIEAKTRKGKMKAVMIDNEGLFTDQPQVDFKR